MQAKIVTKRVCVKVEALRKQGYKHFEEWLTTPGNVYVGRRGRIFIHEGGEKRVFTYGDSKWGNPFPVKEYGLEECLKKYYTHLATTGLYKAIGELRGKNLGCWCKEGELCHGDILVSLVRYYFGN